MAVLISFGVVVLAILWGLHRGRTAIAPATNAFDDYGELSQEEIIPLQPISRLGEGFRGASRIKVADDLVA